MNVCVHLIYATETSDDRVGTWEHEVWPGAGCFERLVTPPDDDCETR